MATWQSFIAQLPSVTLQALAGEVRDTYATQGIPVSFGHFLALDPAQTGTLKPNSDLVRELWKELLLVNQSQAQSYPQYIALFEQPEQLLATALVAVAQQRGMSYADFAALNTLGLGAGGMPHDPIDPNDPRPGDLATPPLANPGDIMPNSAPVGAAAAGDPADNLLAAANTPLWTATLQALQQRGQLLLDTEARRAAFDASVAPDWQAAYSQLLDRVQASNPFASLDVIARMPLNRLALTISPIGNDTAYFNQTLQQLIGQAQQVVSENYLPDTTVEKFLSSASLGREASQAVLQVLATKPAEAIKLLATSSVESLLTTLAESVSADSPLAYAVAKGFQDQVSRFLTTYPPVSGPVGPVQPILPVTQLLQGQALGRTGLPLANVGVRLTQLSAAAANSDTAPPPNPATDVPLGELFTSPDGSFPVRVQRRYTLDAEDTVSELPAALRVEVFAPGSPFTGPADASKFFPLSADQLTLIVNTELTEGLALLDSQPAAQALDQPLPAEVQDYLTSNGLISLADIRHAGGLAKQDDVPFATEEALTAARRLDGLARFEVVSPNAGLHVELLDQGFFSPRELLSTTSRAELVQLLAPEGDPRWSTPEQLDSRRLEVAVLYEQATAVEALAQTVALFAATEQANNSPDKITLLPEGIAELPVAEQFNIPVLDPVTEIGGYSPPTNGIPTTYQTGQQCDCPACRSAVGPTAYLAALLQYARTSLQATASADVTPRFLQNQLLQPFCDMAVTCQYAEAPVCKYRLAIEVLQAQWRTRSVPGPALTLAQGRPYVDAVLEALLQDAGLSTKELQAAATPTARQSLATRLGVTTGVIVAFQQRFGKQVLTNTRPLDTVEDDLEQIFGLGSTARDPLSTGSKLTGSVPTASAVSLVRWNFQGVQWGINSGLDGQLHLDVYIDTPLTALGIPKHKITVYKNSKSEDSVVARGNFVPLSGDAATVGTNQRFAAVLYPQHGSELRGTVIIALSPATAAAPLVSTEFRVAAVPLLTAGRLQYLETEWQQQDAEASQVLGGPALAGWNGEPYVIDPDVLGPDDFRPYDTTALNTLGNPAYVIWRNRLDYLNGLTFQYSQTTSDGLSDLLVGLTGGTNGNATLEYSTIAPVQSVTKKAWTVDAPYEGLTGTVLFDRLQADLTAPDALKTTAALKALASIGLTREAFDRLYALWKKNQQTPVSASEEDEFRLLLRQSVKKTFALAWAQEEAAHGVQLGGQWFQLAIHEPQEGTWAKEPTAEFGIAAAYIPRIDPDEVTPLELPDPGFFGDYAANFWKYRKAELQAKQLAIIASGSNLTDAKARVAAMLEYAYRVDPRVAHPATTSSPFTSSKLEDNWVAYQNSGTNHADALTYFGTTLALRPKETDQLMALYAQVQTMPSDALWLELGRLLTLGWKRAVAYHQGYMTGDAASGYEYLDSWSQSEGDDMTASGAPFSLFMTRKHRLEKWRATAAARASWASALRQALQRPFIDPDQLVAGDFRQAGEHSRNPLNADALKPEAFINPAFGLYSGRAVTVRDWYNQLQAKLPAVTASAPDHLRAYQDLVAAELTTPWAALEELHRQLHENVDVAAALARLNLNAQGLDLLYDQVHVADTDRATEFLHLLVQVRKIRHYADWQREESALRLQPIPRYFREPQTEAVSLASLPWRSAASERRQLKKLLTARYDQTQATVEGQLQAVKSAEDQYLPLLRDVLLDYKVVDGTSRDDKTEQLSARYLLDFKIACCQHSTRVAQAIDVLQKLYFTQRSGLTSPIAGLMLKSTVTSFDADWQWLGSYERWRSLMFLYLYPENVLLPALKPGQTSSFRRLLRDTRQTAQLTPGRADVLFASYANDFIDLTNLKLAATAQAHVAPANGNSRELTVFQIAYAASNKRAYWSTYFTRTEAGNPADLNWQPLPGNEQVERVIGACVFRPTPSERYLCVFAFISNEHRADTANGANSVLAIQRLNLLTWTWDESFKTLEYANNEQTDVDSVLLVSGKNESWLPLISGLRNRRDMVVADLLKPPFDIYNFLNAPADLTGLGGIHLRQVEIFHLRMKDDAQSVEEVNSVTVLGFNDFSLASGIIIDHDSQSNYPDTIAYLCFQKIGADTSNYELSSFFFSVAKTTSGSTATTQTHGFALSPSVSTTLAQLGTSNWVYTQFIGVFAGISIYGVTAIDGFITAALPFDDSNALLAASPQNLGIAKPRAVGLTLVSLPYYSFNLLGSTVSFSNSENQFEFYFETLNNGVYTTNKLRFLFHTIISLNPIGFPPTSFSTTYRFVSIIESDYTVLPERLTYVGSAMVSATDVNELAIALPCLVAQQDTIISSQTFQAITIALSSGTSASLDTSTLPAIYTPAVVSYAAPVTTHVSVGQLPPLKPQLTANLLNDRTVRLRTLLGVAANINGSVLNGLLWEAYYYVPLFMAMELCRAKYYEEALQYSRLYYDYTQATLAMRTTFPGLHDTNVQHFDTVMSWLSDGSNPHNLASLRPDSHLRFAVGSVVRCLLGYGDSEFSRDTSESVSRALSLYEQAVKILRQDVLPNDVQDCYAILNQLDGLIIPAWAGEWQAMKDLLAKVNQRAVLLHLLQDQTVQGVTRLGIIQLFSNALADGNWAQRFQEAWQLIDADLSTLTGHYDTLCDSVSTAIIRTELSTAQRQGLLAPATQDAVSLAVAAKVQQRVTALTESVRQQSGASDYGFLSLQSGSGGTTSANLPAIQLQLALNGTRPFVPFLAAGFCVPTNPVPYALLLQIELNLFKIRTCRNIAGIQRELDPYAAPTDTTSGLPVIGANGQLSRSGRLVVPSTQYRYAYIIERARQLVSLAQQAEASLLSALEKRDSEAYNLLKARQDIAVSKATIQLQNLRSREAEDGIDLANLQLQRSELMENQFQEWLNEGLSEFENNIIDALRVAGIASAAQIGLQATASALNTNTIAATASVGAAAAATFSSMGVLAYYAAGAAGMVAALASSRAQVQEHLASYNRRAQEWTFQRNLAAKDIQIGQQQIHLADDRLRIVGQEKKISELQLDNAEAVLNFLTTKFTNAELYDWMSQILESAYSYFLQQATATARTAELQLAFERQEAPAGLVQEDYWTPPTDSSADPATTAAVDRKGLTGSIRLLQDLTRLDQYAFETNRRKLQLTKTVSLAQYFPTEFVRFRETGVLAFTFPQNWFDQDFPGHYLRIIRRVRTSIIALVPPTEGIKAKLTTAGNSRVVVGGTPFQTLTLPRPPESVSLTSPINATGLFELEQQPGELLYPFEGTGVDVPWILSLQPAANGNLDFSSIADVLISLDYTALESYDYGQQVVRNMPAERQQMVALSFRNRFADQWYDLHHATDLAADDQYVVRFTITDTDLPINMREASIRSISIYVDAPTDDDFPDRSGLSVALGHTVATTRAALTNIYGLISTRTGSGNGPIYTGNAGPLNVLIGTSPVGDWVLDLHASPLLRTRLDAGKVNDVYLILEVEGQAPAYTLI